MTPEQLKQKPFEEIFKKQHEKLETQDGESNEEEEESTTSPEKSEQDSESDNTADDTDASEPIQTYHTNQVLNNTTHDEQNSSEAQDEISEENSVYEIESHLVNGRKTNKKTNSYLSTLKLKLKLKS